MTGRSGTEEANGHVNRLTSWLGMVQGRSACHSGPMVTGHQPWPVFHRVASRPDSAAPNKAPCCGVAPGRGSRLSGWPARGPRPGARARLRCSGLATGRLWLARQVRGCGHSVIPRSAALCGGGLRRCGREELRHGRWRVRGVVVLDQRRRIEADDPGDFADVAPGIEAARAGGEVVALDIADDDSPDPGARTDLSRRQARLSRDCASVSPVLIALLRRKCLDSAGSAEPLPGRGRSCEAGRPCAGSGRDQGSGWLRSPR